MWEFDVKSESHTVSYIDYLYKKLKPSVTKVGGNIAVATSGNDKILSLAVSEKDKNKIKSQLRIYLCDIFCEKMKADYLQKNINCIPNDSDLFMPFVKVCTYFDNELERQIVMRNLSIGHSMVLSSYLEFRLRSSNCKWQELCNLTNQNAELFFQSETFLDILRFLLNNLDYKSECVLVKTVNNSMIFEDSDGVIWSYCYTGKLAEVEIVNKLIELSPVKIVVKMPQEPNKLIDTLVSLFGDRIHIIKS